MRHKQRNPIKLSTTLGAMLLSSMLLASCFNSGGSAAIAIINAGIGGTGIVFGTITGFGSVWVNGRRFEIDESEIIVDGEDFNGDPRTVLDVGMVVRLDVDTENGEFGGSAVKVEFDDEIEGPLNGSPTDVVGSGGSVKQFTILEQKVTIDANRTLFSGTTFGTIADDDVVEVSGFRSDTYEIVATWVRKVTDPPPFKIELRGEIKENDPGVSFKINGVTVNYLNAMKIDVDGGQPMNGMFVEVEGTFVNDTEVDANKIEQEDEDFGADVDDISLQGIVSGYSPTGAGLDEPFFVNGQQVDASMADLDPENIESLMQNGLEVEVEGEIVGGVLIAEELELRDGDTEVRATVFSKDPSGSFVVDFPVGKVTITTSGITVFEDESATPIPDYSFEDLAIGHFVEVEGVEVEGFGTNDTLSAQVVKRREPNDFKLQGAIDTFDDVNHSVTILGITYPMDPGAIYEEDPTVTAADFFATLQNDDIVELEDKEPDGFADAAELDD